MFVVGCGGSAAERPSASAPAPKVEASAVATPQRAASEDLRRRWPFADEPKFVLYGDLAGFAKTELVSGLAPSLLELGRDSMSDVQRECVRSLLAGVRELAVGADEGGPLFLLRFDDAAIKPGAAACLRAVAIGEPIEVAGATAAFARRDDVVALQPGLLAFGTKKLVGDALKGSGSGKWPAGLDLAPDTHLIWRARVPEEKVAGSGTLASSREFFRLDVKAELESDQAAQMIESRISKGRSELSARIAAEPSARAALPLFEAFRVTRDGRTVAFALDLREDPVAQARDIGILVGMAVSSVRKYLLASKVSEAHVMLATIAKSEVEAWRTLTPAKRKLTSLPAVPKEVPHGAKYQSSPGDWKRWEALKLSMTDPQYFQYEVVASKDGKSADIIARGDLDGDGKSSEMKLKIKVNKKGDALEVAEDLEVKDPEE
jgi:hypothetical protein